MQEIIQASIVCSFSAAKLSNVLDELPDLAVVELPVVGRHTGPETGSRRTIFDDQEKRSV
jgi:hypothetical protein